MRTEQRLRLASPWPPRSAGPRALAPHSRGRGSASLAAVAQDTRRRLGAGSPLRGDCQVAVHGENPPVPREPAVAGEDLMDTSDQKDRSEYKVVLNHEEQYSIWPVDRENP